MGKSLSKPKMSISVLSWNVWFDHFRQEERYSFIFEQCLKSAPDVICFQEATPNFVRYLLQSPLLRNYSCSDEVSGMRGQTVIPYGTLSLAKKSLRPGFSFVDMETHMARRLLMTTFNLHGESWSVGNVHLESLNSREYRASQLKSCRAALTSFDHYILCGDYNFCSYRNYNLEHSSLENDNLKLLFPELSDMWEVLHGPNEVFFTFDGVRNRCVRDPNEQMRYDRMCYHFKGGWQPERIVNLNDCVRDSEGNPLPIVGTDAATPLFPSDHFGLLAHFVRPSEESS